MKWKKTFIFILCILTGITLGVLLTQVCANVSWLSWLNVGGTVGIGYPTPVSLDLNVIKLQLGFGIDINLIKMICLLASLLLYGQLSKRV